MPALKQRGSAKESFASSAEACFTIEIGFESSAGSMYTAPVCACVRVRETEKSLSLPGFETSHVVNTILLRLIYAYRLPRDFLIYNTIRCLSRLRWNEIIVAQTRRNGKFFLPGIGESTIPFTKDESCIP